MPLPRTPRQPARPGDSPPPEAAVRRKLCQHGTAAHGAGTGISLGLALLLVFAAAPVSAADPACTAAQAAALPFAPRLQALAPQRWLAGAARGESTPDNGGVVTQALLLRDGARLWLVGSGPTPEQGRALRCTIEAALGRPVGDVVNTRAHPELALGNLAFEPARFWALHDVARAMAARCADCVARLRERLGAQAPAGLRAEAVRAPDRLLGRDGAAQGRLGPFRWWAWPRAPGERTLVLRTHDSRLLLAQGLVWVGGVPNLRETDSALLLAGLRRLRALAGTAVVVGEQGGPGSVADIDRHIAYLVALRSAVRAALERGDEPVAALEAIVLPDFADLAGHADIHPLNRQRVWREIEAEVFR